MKSLLAVSIVLGWIMCGAAAEKPRVFITDSKSWEMSGGVGGTQDGFGGASKGGARRKPPKSSRLLASAARR